MHGLADEGSRHGANSPQQGLTVKLGAQRPLNRQVVPRLRFELGSVGPRTRSLLSCRLALLKSLLVT
jgi:hypothetical protein